MRMENISLLIGVGEATAQVVGVPLAASLANEIVKSCEDVAKDKKNARMLGVKSLRLLAALEAANGLEGTEMQVRIDEVTSILESTLNRTQKWANMPLVVRWWKRADIQFGIQQLNQELDTALQVFALHNQISQERRANQTTAETRSNDAENKEMLRQILANQETLGQVAALHQSGETIAIELMQGGQEALRQMRTISGRSKRPGAPPERTPAGRSYQNLQRGLMTLHDLTGIPPSVNILDGEIRREDDIALAGGVNSDIWKGLWLGQKHVALKALRAVKADNTKAQEHFLREIKIWSKLTNKHILSFYGIVTDIGTQIHMVSPWLDNGNVLEYLKKNQEANKLQLVKDAAEGLSYLHSASIVHGNIRCNNILVKDSGEACITDFGMAGVLEDVTKISASTTLRDAGYARWMAPEVVDGESPTKASDTYSFAMTILELLTGKHPLAELKTEFAIIRAMAHAPIQPKRPVTPDVSQWLTDELWSLMTKCWNKREVRPAMEEVSNELQAM